MTIEEFKKLKVGDKVKIRKYCPNKDDMVDECHIFNWVPNMSHFIGKTCVISYIGNEPPFYGYFNIAEDVADYYFHYKAIDEVISVEAKDETYDPIVEARGLVDWLLHIRSIPRDSMSVDKSVEEFTDKILEEISGYLDEALKGE